MHSLSGCLLSYSTDGFLLFLQFCVFLFRCYAHWICCTQIPWMSLHRCCLPFTVNSVRWLKSVCCHSVLCCLRLQCNHIILLHLLCLRTCRVVGIGINRVFTLTIRNFWNALYIFAQQGRFEFMFRQKGSKNSLMPCEPSIHWPICPGAYSSQLFWIFCFLQNVLVRHRCILTFMIQVLHCQMIFYYGLFSCLLSQFRL